MDRYTDSSANQEFGPICKFGPGGDFVSAWPGKSWPRVQENGLGRLLAAIGEMMGVIHNAELSVAASVRAEVRSEKEKAEDTVGNIETKEPGYTPSIRIVKGDKRVQSEPMLFADDSGVGGAVRHKPKHRVRAYSRAAKKRVTFGAGGQGTLFEPDFKSAKTA